MTDLGNHDRNRVTRNIPKYFAFTILRGTNFGLIIATWVLFLQQEHGLTLTQVTMVDVAFWIAATLGEVPTGVVADRYGRKTSLIVGGIIMSLSMIMWTLAPTVTLIVVSYILLAIGVTFMSGADDAFLFESLKNIGRGADYTRVAGRVGAVSMTAGAVGSILSGLLATVDLRLPFALAALCLIAMLGVTLSFKEPKRDNEEGEPGADGSAHIRDSYGTILRRSLAIMRQKPSLRYAVIYMTLVPIAAMILETVFLQPQAMALGVPLAAIGVVVTALQITRIIGSNSSYRIKSIFGDAKIIYVAPYVISASLILLGMVQVLPTIIFIAVISFVTALLRPIVMYRIQSDVTDNIRATVLSMQSLTFAGTIAVIEPILGYIADQAGLPASYYVLAGILTLLTLLLFWKARPNFP